MSVKIGFCSLKGGVGKSTIAEIFSSILCFEKGLRVLVVDCDEVQHSFYNLRQRDFAALKDYPAFNAKVQSFYKESGREPYTVIQSSLSRMENSLKNILLKRKVDEDFYDVIIYDFPGRFDNEVVAGCFQMDYLFSPLEPDIQSLASCLSFGKLLKNHWDDLMNNGCEIPLVDFYFFWNKIVKSARKDAVEYYKKAFLNAGMKCLKTEIPSTVKLSKEQTLMAQDGVFRSSLVPPDKGLRIGTNIDELVTEILEILKL